MNIESNTEFLTRIMNHSSSGALTQIFIPDAIIKQATLTADADITEWPKDHMISGTAWQGTARGIMRELNVRRASMDLTRKLADLRMGDKDESIS